MKSFPFPNRDLALEELKRDYVIAKIPKQDYEKIIEISWKQGLKAAALIKETFQAPYDFIEIAEKNGLVIINQNIDRVIGNFRFFSEYITKQNKIFMYVKSIQQWSTINQLTYQQGYNLVLAHEFMHFLEYKKLGFTSKMYQVPIIKLNKLQFGKTGIRAMSEIAAHAFVNELFIGGYHERFKL